MNEASCPLIEQNPKGGKFIRAKPISLDFSGASEGLRSPKATAFIDRDLIPEDLSQNIRGYSRAFFTFFPRIFCVLPLKSLGPFQSCRSVLRLRNDDKWKK